MKFNEEEYKRISNKSIAADTFIKIRNGALAITKQDIYKYVLDKKISKQNIGIRQSITIDSFDDNDGKKVYHFVNLGDKERKISGIQNNINNLVNENKNNSLNRKTQNIADFFKTKEIDPYISTVILNNAIANIFFILTILKYWLWFSRISVY
ncbi:hypothetical protein NW062_06290 [Mycoplasmopsis cynos]|nr:hypothetical protein NW062_06290 [Mycoplasmopsis cynos]